MQFLKNILRPRSEPVAEDAPSEQAVFVYLNGLGLPESVYAEYDLATLEDLLIKVISRDQLGEVDGNEIGPQGAIIYMYSYDAERLYEGIEATLRAHPLCQGARVVIRKGGPGAAKREVHI